MSHFRPEQTSGPAAGTGTGPSIVPGVVPDADKPHPEPHRSGDPEQRPSRRPPRADARRNREAILEAAITVLAARPGAGMAEIASAGGFARATLYRHFSSRDDLVRAIQERAVSSGARALAEADLGRGPAPLALRRAISGLIGVGDRYRLLAREAAIDPSVLQGRPEVAGNLLGLIRRGQDEGSFRTDLPPVWILATLANLLVLALREMAAQDSTADQMTERVASTLIAGIGPGFPGSGPGG